jgi:hypothetical protein
MAYDVWCMVYDVYGVWCMMWAVGEEEEEGDEGGEGGEGGWEESERVRGGEERG